MFMLKGCPRCRGDLYTGLDDEISCMQCGYELRPGERDLLSTGRVVENERVPTGAHS